MRRIRLVLKAEISRTNKIQFAGNYLSLYSSNRSLDGRQSQSRQAMEEKNLCPCRESNPSRLARREAFTDCKKHCQNTSEAQQEINQRLSTENHARKNAESYWKKATVINRPPRKER
jgi:hypothetical protein